MKKRDEIIWNNVLKLANKKGWNKTRLAKEVGTNTSVLNNIKGGFFYGFKLIRYGLKKVLTFNSIRIKIRPTSKLTKQNTLGRPVWNKK